MTGPTAVTVGSRADLVPTTAEERESKALTALNARGKDLADLTDAEFEAGLARLKMVQSRMARLLDTALIEGAHYGNPEGAFKKPMLFQAGAQELRRLMRLNLSRTAPDAIVSSPDYCEAVVTLGIYDQGGRFIVERKGTCTSREKRFKKFGASGGWIYDDAREVLHVVISMAEKRAATLCTLEASGATAFLANGEEMAEALDDDAADKPITPWTEAEKRTCYAAAAKKGIGRAALARLTLETLGRAVIGTGDDVSRLLAAIEAVPAKGSGKDSPAAAAAPAPEPGEAAE